MFTDKPLLAALCKSSEPLSARQVRHLAAIAKYTSDIRHVSGKDNLVAKAPSRVNSVQPAGPGCLPTRQRPPAVSFPRQPPIPATSGVEAEDPDLVEFPALFPPFQSSSPDLQLFCGIITAATFVDMPALAAAQSTDISQ